MTKASSSQWTIVPIKTPEEQMKIFTENVQQLKSPEEIAEIPKLTRRFKYATEEEARTAALLLKKKNRARDQQKIRDYKYRAVDSQLQLVRRLKRLVISDPEDLVQLHKIVDKYDEYITKNIVFLNITDVNQILNQYFTQEDEKQQPAISDQEKQDVEKVEE